MKLAILAIGKAKKSPEAILTAERLKRLPFPGGVTEFESPQPAGPARTANESVRILDWLDNHAPRHSRLICLDPKAGDTSSETLAEMIRNWREEGINCCYFAIGGADGHHPNLVKKSDKRIAFGTAIWPHMLFRAMLAEQLYRAEMILAGHPYHRG